MAKFEKGDLVKHTKQGEFGYPRSRGTVEDPNWTGGMIGVRWADGSFDSINPSELKIVKESIVQRMIREELKSILAEANKGQFLGVFSGRGFGKGSLMGFRRQGKTYTNIRSATQDAEKIAERQNVDTKVIGVEASDGSERYFVAVGVKNSNESINEMSQLQIKKITQVATNANQKEAITKLAKLGMKDLREYQKMVQNKIAESYRSNRYNPMRRWQFVDKVVGSAIMHKHWPLFTEQIMLVMEAIRITESNPIKTPADAQKVIVALKKLNTREAQGAISILKRDWQTVAKHDRMADAIMDMVKKSPDYRRWKQSQGNSIEEFGETAKGKFRGVIPQHELPSSGRLPSHLKGFKKLPYGPWDKSKSVSMAKQISQKAGRNTYVVQMKSGKYYIFSKESAGVSKY